MVKQIGEVTANLASENTWDMSDAPQFPCGASEMPGKTSELSDTAPETQRADLKSEIQLWSNEYNVAEQQFAQYTKSLDWSNMNPDDKERYRQTLLEYEDDISQDWQRLEEATNKAWESQLIRSVYELADTQRLGVVEPGETIEAATGIFYEERAQALNQAILGSEESKERQADHTVLRQTWRKVLDYIEATTDYEFLHRNYEGYHSMRRTCHNQMIRQLNDLNSLTEKYGTMRFTARDFLTNDFSYSSKRDRGSLLNHRANYDRESVLAYFQTAFRSDFDDAEKKSKTKERGLTSGVFYYD